MGDDGFAFGGSQYAVAQSDDGAGRDVKLEGDAVAFGLDLQQFALAAGDDIDHLAGKRFGNMHCKVLNGLVLHPVDAFEDNLRLADLELESLAPHGLHQDRQVQDPSSINHVGIGRAGFFDAQGQVLLGFPEKPVAQVAGGDEPAVFAEKW